MGESSTQSLVLLSTNIYKFTSSNLGSGPATKNPASFGIDLAIENGYYYFIIYNWGYVKTLIRIIALT